MLKHLIISTITTISLLAGPTSCPSHYLEGNAPDIVNQKLTQKSKELCFEGFVVMHSGLTKTPLWSAEYLTREKIAAPLKRKDMFHPESRLSSSERAELSDYAKSGYDRGHMTPSANMGTESAQAESFSLANMVPQNKKLNQNLCSAIEGATRHLANKEGGIFVITGAMFKGDNLIAIGKNNVLVPTQVYKVIYNPQRQMGAAYLCDNAPGDNYKVVSIAEIEALAGINFFPKLSKAQKEKMLELPAPKKRGK